MIMKDDGGSLCINDLKNFIYHRYIPILARKIIAEKYCSMKKSAYICHRLQCHGSLSPCGGRTLNLAAKVLQQAIGRAGRDCTF